MGDHLGASFRAAVPRLLCANGSDPKDLGLWPGNPFVSDVMRRGAIERVQEDATP